MFCASIHRQHPRLCLCDLLRLRVSLASRQSVQLQLQLFALACCLCELALQLLHFSSSVWISSWCRTTDAKSARKAGQSAIMWWVKWRYLVAQKRFRHLLDRRLQCAPFVSATCVCVFSMRTYLCILQLLALLSHLYFKSVGGLWSRHAAS
ncbi:hypothetical protein IWX48DRAFT_627853 [Phyllosticta citricarpa]